MKKEKIDSIRFQKKKMAKNFGNDKVQIKTGILSKLGVGGRGERRAWKKEKRMWKRNFPKRNNNIFELNIFLTFFFSGVSFRPPSVG